MKLKIAICEDDFIISSLLESYMEELGYEVSFVVDTQSAFLERLNDETPDLALLDINLDENSMEGIQIGEILKSEKIPFIYVTAYTDASTLQSAVVTEPEGYIVKPFTQQQLGAQIELVRSKIEAAKSELKVYSTEGVVELDLTTVEYIESSRNYALFYDSETKEPLKLRVPLKEIVGNLPEFMVQIHRSFIININALKKVIGDKCLLKSGTELPLSRGKKSEIKLLLEQYIR